MTKKKKWLPTFGKIVFLLGLTMVVFNNIIQFLENVVSNNAFITIGMISFILVVAIINSKMLEGLK